MNVCMFAGTARVLDDSIRKTLNIATVTEAERHRGTFKVKRMTIIVYFADQGHPVPPQNSPPFKDSKSPGLPAALQTPQILIRSQVPYPGHSCVNVVGENKGGPVCSTFINKSV